MSLRYLDSMRKKTAWLQVRISPETRDRYKSEAAARSLTVSQFAIQAIEKAIRKRMLMPDQANTKDGNIS
jgi:uncharacterized protein (DUF1778 family)